VKLLLDECVMRHLKRDLAGHEVLRTGTEFQELGKCFELFPGEFLDDAARRRISWFGG